MKLYAGTTEQFRADAQMHRIAEKSAAEYAVQIGHMPAPPEIHSWQNSLMALSMLVDQAELHDHGVILEFQLGANCERGRSWLQRRAIARHAGLIVSTTRTRRNAHGTRVSQLVQPDRERSSLTCGPDLRPKH